jgi:hypothetical protein
MALRLCCVFVGAEIGQTRDYFAEFVGVNFGAASFEITKVKVVSVRGSNNPSGFAGFARELYALQSSVGCCGAFGLGKFVYFGTGGSWVCLGNF